MTQDGNVLSRLDEIRNLPTLPVVMQKLRSAIYSPHADARRIARIIEDDPSMMTRVMKIVNSAFYSGAEPITSIQHAIARMGFHAVNNIAMSTCVFSTLKPKEGQKGLDKENFWRHSISIGLANDIIYQTCANRLTKQYRKDVLHLAGLVHDIGKIIFDQFFHNEFVQAIERAESNKLPLVRAEADCTGTDHTAIGAWLGAKWNLSEDIIQAIRWHHEPHGANVDHACLATICHCADYICNIEKIGNGGNPAPELHQESWDKLGLTGEKVSSIVQKIRAESEQSEVLLSFI